MGFSYIGSAASEAPDSSSSVTWNYPGATRTGDVVVLAVSQSNLNATSYTFTGPAGWTEWDIRSDDAIAGSSTSLNALNGIWWDVYASGDPDPTVTTSPTPTGAPSNIDGFLMVFRGLGGLIDVEVTQYPYNTGAPIQPTEPTVSKPSDVVLAFVQHYNEIPTSPDDWPGAPAEWDGLLNARPGGTQGPVVGHYAAFRYGSADDFEPFLSGPGMVVATMATFDVVGAEWFQHRILDDRRQRFTR